MRIVAKIVILGLVILGVGNFVPGISIANFYSALLAALFLGALNLLVRPLLLILTIPINLLTFGLFTLVLNTLMFALAASLTPGFEIAGVLAAFVGALVVSVAHWLLNLVL